MDKRPEYIQLDSNEDVPSVRDRLSFIRGRRVLLIWPEKGTALTNKLQLVLIQREAKRRNIQLAFVTHDPQVMRHARELGISTFETIGSSERKRWNRGRTRVFIQRYHKPEAEPEPEELMPVASRVQGRRKRTSARQLILSRIIITGILLIVFASIAAVVLPYAEIQLTPLRETITVDAEIIASPNVGDVDIDTSTIPATVVRATVQTVGEVETTGDDQIQDARAIGFVSFSNQTTNPVTIPSSTIVSTSTSNPVRFQTSLTGTVRGGVGQQVEIPIQALPDSAGTSGNLDAGMINRVEGDLEALVTVRNLAPTTGGETRGQRVVNLADQERLMGIVRGQLQALAYNEMQSNLEDNQIIVIETVHIAEERADWTTFSHNPGDISDTLSLNMRVVVEALVVDDRFASQVVFAQLSSQKPANLIIIPESYSYTRGPVSSISGSDEVSFMASGTAQIGSQVDFTQMQQRIAGKSIAAASEIIRANNHLAPETEPAIEIVPAWWGRLPLLPLRIDIQILDVP